MIHHTIAQREFTLTNQAITNGNLALPDAKALAMPDDLPDSSSEHARNAFVSMCEIHAIDRRVERFGMGPALWE